MLKRSVMIMTMMILCGPGHADITVKSDVFQTNLIELYTSEGCSSCPPADRWLSTLKDHPDLWQQLIPMAFHVDYWNHIGWRDRFSKPGYSNRQRSYAREEAVSTVYTPGLVSNGKEWRNFSWQAPAQIEKIKAGVLEFTVSEKNLSIKFEPATTLTTNKLVANVVLLGFEMVSDVRSGENAGRKLNHDFVVLKYKRTRLKVDQGLYHVTTHRPASKMNAGRYAIAVWVSTNDAQTPLQAVGGWLED